METDRPDHVETHRKVVGARKLWLRLRRDGHDIARCTVVRLMRDLGIAGVRAERRKNPVDTALRETGPADLVDRHFGGSGWTALGRGLHLRLELVGMVYVAFVFDAHSRCILGWRAATSMTTPLVLDCLEMAIWARRREGASDPRGTHASHRRGIGPQNRTPLIPIEEMRKKIEAAVNAREDDDFLIIARSDTQGSVYDTGDFGHLDEQIKRLNAHVEAGADAVFPVAPHFEGYKRVFDSVDAPIKFCSVAKLSLPA